MTDNRQQARTLLAGFKGDNYAFGSGVLDAVGGFAQGLGKTALVIANDEAWLKSVVETITASLAAQGVELAGGRVYEGARPNTPVEDVYRIETYILHTNPDCIVAVGAGSTIDAVKAANVLATLGKTGPDIDQYFGVGLVTQALADSQATLRPLVAVQTAASSGAHLTKYSNITDVAAGQKKLIVDEAIVPPRAVFDYSVTKSMPVSLTIDGALDAMAHCLEVFYGAQEAHYELLANVTRTALELVIENTKVLVNSPHNLEAREALGLATDLGGYAIMVGGTNGAHLTSFSLIDVASHGRACGIMNPYYTVFYAPAIQPQLRLVGQVLKEAGFVSDEPTDLHGRELGLAVAKGMVSFARSVDAPTTLNELPGFSPAHIDRALTAAKNPQLEMKLKNMPVPLTANEVDAYMRPILVAASTGDFAGIRNLA